MPSLCHLSESSIQPSCSSSHIPINTTDHNYTRVIEESTIILKKSYILCLFSCIITNRANTYALPINNMNLVTLIIFYVCLLETSYWSLQRIKFSFPNGTRSATTVVMTFFYYRNTKSNNYKIHSS